MQTIKQNYTRNLILGCAIVMSIGITTSINALAQEAASGKSKEKWESLSPEEQAKWKEQFREKAKEKWETMTPEERTAAKEKFKEKVKSRLEKMTPEERKEAREKIRDRRKARQSGN